MAALKGVVIGAGYFSQFHYDGWCRIDDVDIVACCDRDEQRLQAAVEKFAIAKHYTDYRRLLDEEKPDFVDIVTPPATHLEICGEAADRGISIMCQKPLAPTLEDGRALIERTASVRTMVHENFRFQPWIREIKRLLDESVIGDKLHSLNVRNRPGDGWGNDAYLGRQPYFREMPRLLIYEACIHFIDTFRYLAGEVDQVTCLLRRLNPVIAGEDCGLLILEFRSGAVGLVDANRFNESDCEDPRYTFGEYVVEGNGGSIRLALDGSLSIQPLGEAERRHDYVHEKKGFSGDCCHATQRHFIERLIDGKPFETGAAEYYKNLVVQEALYRSAAERRTISVDEIT